MAISDIDHS